MAVPFVLWILTVMGKSFSARPAIALVVITALSQTCEFWSSKTN